MLAAQKLSSEEHLQPRCNDEVKMQRRRWTSYETIKGGSSLFEQIHLIEPTIFFFLGFYVGPDHLFINPSCGKKISPGPEMLTGKVLSLSKVHPRNLDGALSLEKP